MAFTGKSNYAEALMIKWLWTTDAVTRPSIYYMALFTTVPTSDDGTGAVEVSGGSYVRFGKNYLTFASPDRASFGSCQFSSATADWGTLNGWGIYDASSGGNLLTAGTFHRPFAIYDKDQAAFLDIWDIYED